MEKFKKNKYSIVDEGKSNKDVRVMKPDNVSSPEVKNFDYSKFSTQVGDYNKVKSMYGSFAVTDSERDLKAQKDKRFNLSPLLRGPLSVEEEEKRALDERVRSRVAALAKEARDQARTDGYTEGLQKGYQEAFDKFRQEGVERLSKLDELLTGFEAAKVDVFRANERFLLELIFRISRMVLLKELSADKNYLLRLIRELIDRVGVRENITIRINPEELKTLSMLEKDIADNIGTLKNISIEGSKQVATSGCIVETEWNAIDATVETQLKGIYEALIATGTTKSET
jgi:flagellar biosynthesis/type III secretory pathway protein FliH